MKEFKGDYRIMRVVFSSDNPMEVLHKFRTGQYSVITLFDMLELLDVRETIREDEIIRQKAKQPSQKK